VHSLSYLFLFFSIPFPLYELGELDEFLILYELGELDEFLNLYELDELDEFLILYELGELPISCPFSLPSGGLG
jgi:hypothetical protein